MVQGYWIIGCIFFIKFPTIKQRIPIQQSADHKLIDFELLSIDFTKRVKSKINFDFGSHLSTITFLPQRFGWFLHRLR